MTLSKLGEARFEKLPLPAHGARAWSLALVGELGVVSTP